MGIHVDVQLLPLLLLLQVAKLGKQVLRLAQCELAPLSAVPTPRQSLNPHVGAYPSGISPAAQGSGAAGHGSQGNTSVSSSLGSLTQKFVKSSRSWRSGFSATSKTAPPSASSTPSSSSPPSPPRDMQTNYSRQPFILRSTAQQQDSMGHASSNASQLGPNDYGDGMSDSRLNSGQMGVHYAGDDVHSKDDLPQSQIFKLSCEYFSRPMLEPMVSVVVAIQDMDCMTPLEGALDTLDDHY